MPRNRVQVGPLAAPVPLQPQANPVDTFHRPDQVPLNQGPDDLQQLASALGQVAPSVFRAGDIQHAEQTQQAMSEGEQAVLADKRLQNQKALREAVARGDIPAAQNPWFYQGMRQQVYRIEGENYDQALRQAYVQSDAQNQDDISDFMGGFTQKYLENLGADPQDPETARILTPAIERSQSNLMQVHRNQRDQAIVQTVEQNTDVEIGLAIDNQAELGTSPEFTAKAIHGIIEQQFQNGLSGTRANEIAAQSITRKAIEKLDTSYLDLLDKIPSGPDGKSNLGQISYIKNLRREAESTINRAWFENDSVRRKKDEMATKAAIQAAKAEVIKRLGQDPTSDISDQVSVIVGLDADEAEKVNGWRHSAISRHEEDDEDRDAVDNLTAKVYAGNGNADDIMLARQGGLINGKTSSKLISDIERSKEFRSPLRQPDIQELHRALGFAIRGNTEDDKSARAVNALRAQNALIGDLMDFKDNWAKSHSGAQPDATALWEFARKRQQQLLETYAPDSNDAAGTKTVDDVLRASPDAVDWHRDVILKGDKLKAAVKEYALSNGRSGVLADISRHLKVSATEFVKAQQQAALPRPPVQVPK